MSFKTDIQPPKRHNETGHLLQSKSQDSICSSSSSSLNTEIDKGNGLQHQVDAAASKSNLDPLDIEDGDHISSTSPNRSTHKVLWIFASLGLTAWVVALIFFLFSTSSHPIRSTPSPVSDNIINSSKTVSLEQVLSGQWRPRIHHVSWIDGINGEDGLLVERGDRGRDYLVVTDVRSKIENAALVEKKVLMQDETFFVGPTLIIPSEVWPSTDLKKVLVMSDRENNWRHSYTGKFWIFDVDSQTAEALDTENVNSRVQLASWSPRSDAIIFTRENNLFIRKLNSDKIAQITKDGGPNIFYGRPDWVYEEEVLSGNSATWWSQDGKYVAFFRTDESRVPTYPIQYFLSRPSGRKPLPGLENYPEVRNIKYPKPGAPNPMVLIQFYDVEKDEVFSIDIKDDFPDEDRLITEVIWAGNSGKVLVRETNRVSDKMKMILIDVKRRTGRVVREVDVDALDGGWFEISEETTYVPSDPGKNRPHEGYIDTIIHEGFDHLAYFTPLDNPQPILLTSGQWEVVKAPSAVDLKRNWVYFRATRNGSVQRHVYRVNLDGSSLQPVTDTSMEAYYDVSFSTGAGFALLNYLGPSIPYQKVRSISSEQKNFEWLIEENASLKKLTGQVALPNKLYSTIIIDGYELNVVERRPPQFDETKQYPVLFYLYNGPNYQSVDKKFTVDFQSFVASDLGYIVVTLDGRGTGFRGRPTRVIVRDNIGYHEASDQIQAAKIWAAKDYVDEKRMAIWGWSYGGFMTLKVLEQDSGRTFQYGMAVAPVTDWRFYGKLQ